MKRLCRQRCILYGRLAVSLHAGKLEHTGIDKFSFWYFFLRSDIFHHFHRLHFVTFPEGTLAEHYEKLIYSEHRFYMLDQVPFPVSNCELDDMFPELIQQVIRQQNPTQILHARVLGAKNISAQNIEPAIHPTSTYGLPHQIGMNKYAFI